MNLAENQLQLDELARKEQAAVCALQEDVSRPGIVNLFTRRWRLWKGYRELSKERGRLREVNDSLFAAFISMVQQQDLGVTSVPLAYMLTYFCFVSPRWFDLLSSETFPPALDAWYKPEEDDSCVCKLCAIAKAGGITAEHQTGCLPVLLLNAKRVQEREQFQIKMSNSINVQDVLAHMPSDQFPNEVTSFMIRRVKEGQP